MFLYIVNRSILSMDCVCHFTPEAVVKLTPTMLNSEWGRDRLYLHVSHIEKAGSIVHAEIFSDLSILLTFQSKSLCTCIYSLS